MRIRPAIALFTIVFSISFAGCLGKVKYPTYYTLQLPPAPAVPAQGPANASIAIREFRASQYLLKGAIAYRPSPEQIGFYEYHRWATEPPRAVTEAVVDHLRASGSFNHVKIYDGRSDVDYVLTGRLEKLDEVDYGGGVTVEVALSAQLTDARTGKTVWENSASESASVNQREVPAVVASMSQAMDRTIVKLLASLPAPKSNAGGF